MIKEISQFIEDLALGPPWVIGVNLFVGHVMVKNVDGDETPQRYLAVLENAGGALLENVGGVVTATPPSTSGDASYFPRYVEKAIQLLNRDFDYDVARADAQALFDALHQTAGWNLPIVDAGPQYLAIVIDAQSDPAPLENPEEKGLFTFSTNYIWKIEEASCGV